MDLNLTLIRVFATDRPKKGELLLLPTELVGWRQSSIGEAPNSMPYQFSSTTRELLEVRRDPYPTIYLKFQAVTHVSPPASSGENNAIR